MKKKTRSTQGEEPRLYNFTHDNRQSVYDACLGRWVTFGSDCKQYITSYKPDENCPVKTQAQYPYTYDPFILWARPNPGWEELSKVNRLSGCYSDRLASWLGKELHSGKQVNLRDLARKHLNPADGRPVGDYWPRNVTTESDKIQDLLREALESPTLVLLEVQEHVNVSNGYPLWYFCYDRGEPTQPKT